MFHIIGFFLIVLFLIIVLGLTILFKVVGFVTGFGRKKDNEDHQYNAGGNTSSGYANQTSGSTKQPHGKKKVFDDNEGEYIEFEEIKD